MDATGRFPVISIDGKQYIMIFYSEHGNYIKVFAIANRTKACIVAVYEEALRFFQTKGLTPTFQRVDNEISAPYKALLDKNNITLDLVPPGQHRRNKAERAIRTFKNHFISILAGVDPAFPANLWTSLLEQAEITINLLRESTVNPRISAWEEIQGPFNFSATPMAPQGMMVTVHNKADQRGTWSKHGQKGFYTGPALLHYRCYTTRIESTGAQRITDTVAWHPHGYSLPAASPLEMVKEAAESINKALTTLSQSNIVSANNAQPLQAVITAIDVNLTDLVSLFTDGITKQRVTESTLPSSTLERQQPNVSEQQSPVKTFAPAPIKRVQTKVISAHQTLNPEIPPGFSALQK